MTDVQPDDPRAGKIIAKHCRTEKNGRILRCGPSRGERIERAREGRPSVGKKKVIYDSEAAARACADELSAALGWTGQRPYLCRRSKHGHHHLTQMGARS